MAAEHTQEHHGHEGGHGHHVIPMKMLVTTFGLLVLFMVLTIAAAEIPHYVPGLPGWLTNSYLTNAIALGIACFKAALVIQTFMGVKFTSNVIKFYAYGGFVWFTLIGITLLDYWSRPYEPVAGWEKAPSTALPRDPRLDGTDPTFQKFRLPESEAGGH